MDFTSLINAAQENVSKTHNKRNFYKSSFEPPKRATPKEKKLSDNIKRFLDKQKTEEEEKLRRSREKKLELIARRDPKEQRKIDKTLKVIKSSKKFYTGDKNLDENTEITLQNDFSLADNDDYGFESKTSEQLHLKLMEKYKKMPQDNKFSSSSSKSKSKSSTIGDPDNDHHIKTGQRQRVSKLKNDNEPSPSSSNKKKSSSNSASVQPSSSEKKITEKPKIVKPKLKAAPIVNFEELLKLAEQKQHEDIVIDLPTKKEPERLLTLKEKREMEELEAARKAKKERNGIPKIPKLGAIPRIGESSKHDKNNNNNNRSDSSSPNDSKRKMVKIDNKPYRSDQLQQQQQKIMSQSEKIKPPSVKQPLSNSKLRDALNKNESPQPSTVSKSLAQKPQSSSKSSINSNTKYKDNLSKSIVNDSKNVSSSSLSNKMDKPRQSTSNEPIRTREFPPRDLQRTREFPPRDLKRTRDFPPRDVRRPQQPQKRRIVDEDSEDEYDSELDDFIDDGEAEYDYSSEIKKMFGYDKSRYRDEDFDDRMMESDYRTVMREEFISKKIGIMEDLEDMKMEAEEIKRKEIMRKKKRKC